MTIGVLASLALHECLEEKSFTAHTTYRSHANNLRNYWKEDTDIRSITLEQLKQWGKTRLLKIKPSSLCSEKSFFNRMYRIAEEHQVAVVCQLGKVKIPPPYNQRDRLIENEEFVDIRGAVDPWDYSIIEIFRNTFMRRLELFKMRSEDVRLKKTGQVVLNPLTQKEEPLYIGWAKIHSTDPKYRHSKNGRPRNCPLNNTAAALFRMWLTERPGPYVISPQVGDRFMIAKAWTARVWVAVCRKLQILNAHLHDVRASGATASLLNGAKERQISLMLGHSKITQTQTYLRTKDLEMWPAAFASQLGLPANQISLNEVPGFSGFAMANF